MKKNFKTSQNILKIKNFPRETKQLGMLSIENGIVRSIDLENIFRDFAKNLFLKDVCISIITEIVMLGI